MIRGCYGHIMAMRPQVYSWLNLIYCNLVYQACSGCTQGCYKPETLLEAWPTSTRGEQSLPVCCSNWFRVRPWYMAACSSRHSDLVMILDASGSMDLNGRFAIAVAALSTLLDSASSTDYINVIVVRVHSTAPILVVILVYT